MQMNIWFKLYYLGRKAFSDFKVFSPTGKFGKRVSS